MTEELLQEEIDYNNKVSSLLKFDIPIGRKKYFVNSLIIGASMILLGVVCKYLDTIILSLPTISALVYYLMIVLIMVFLIYLNVLNDSKRLWDCCSMKHVGLLLGICLLVIDIVLFCFKFSVVSFIVYLCLILIPGKLIK